jgi:hypothetical protein
MKYSVILKYYFTPKKQSHEKENFSWVNGFSPNKLNGI